jgi:hypothetical protein
MRADMFKVIVERPRRGHHSAGKLKVPRDDRTNMPNGRGRGTKSLNENLKPLERFLRGNAGRPWSKVYAEICEGLNVRSAVQKHVRDHLSGLVDLRVFERDGELWTILVKPKSSSAVCATSSTSALAAACSGCCPRCRTSCAPSGSPR